MSEIRLLALGLVVAVCAGTVGGVSAALAADSSPVAALPAFGLPSDANLTSDAALHLNDTPKPLDLIDLAAISDAGVATAQALTAEQWNLTDLEWSLRGDPYAAFAFVRDHIAFQPYAGVLRGPEGTLAARSGNAFDRALLLKTLLDSMLVPARFAFAQLDDTAAARVLARTFEAPTSPLQDAGMASVAPLDPAAILSRAQRDYARIRLALGDRVNSLGSGAANLALAETKQHVWVQMAAGPTWVDLDTTMADAVAGQPLASATVTLDAIPVEDFQTVDLQVVARIDTDGQLADQTVLDRSFTAAGNAISELFLYFQPDVSGLGGTILNTLTGIQGFQPELLVNGTVESGSTFTVDASGLDVFGNPSGSPAQLAGLQLIVTGHAPGEPASTSAQSLLDRVPTAFDVTSSVPLNQLLPLAGDQGGAYALQRFHHVQISTGGADPRDHAIQRAAVADFGGELSDPQSAADYAMQDILWPMAVADKALALVSERAIVAGLSDRPDVQAVIAQPRVFITSMGPDPTTSSGVTFDTNLALDGVRIVAGSALDSPTVARYRLWYGALQTALESEYQLGVARSLDPAARRMVGASFATSQAATLTVLDANSVPPSAPAALLNAVHDGLIVLVPGDAASTHVWWTVDSTGDTRSILDPGLGGVASGGRYGGVRQQPPRPRGGSGNFKFQRPVEPPSRCGGGQEYVALLGCISLPAAWAIRVTVFVAVTIACQYAWTTLVIN